MPTRSYRSRGLAAGQYWLKVSTDRIPTVYELDFVVGSSAGSSISTAILLTNPEAIRNASGEVVRAANTATIYDLNSVIGVPLKQPATGASEVFYRFVLDRKVTTSDHISLNAFDAASSVTLELLDVGNGYQIIDSQVSGGVDSPAFVSLQGLEAGHYVLRVASTGNARYELAPRVNAGTLESPIYGRLAVDLSARSEQFMEIHALIRSAVIDTSGKMC